MIRTTSKGGIFSAVAMFLVLGLTGCGTASNHGPKASQEAANYFKDKTLTLIAPDKPGGGYDRWDRLIAPYLAQVLHAQVRVVNYPGAGTIVGTNILAAAPPNGLTIGDVDVGGDIGNLLTHGTGEQFNLTKLSWIGAGVDAPVAIFARSQSSIKTFSDLLRLKNTGTPVRVLDVASGVGLLTTRVVMNAFHIPYTLLTGYSSDSSLKAGFLRGDGQLAASTFSSWRSLIKGGTAVPLLVTELDPTWTGHPQVLTLGKVMSQTHLSSSTRRALTTVAQMDLLSFDLAGPANMPKDRWTVLHRAFRDVLHNQKFIAQAKKEGLALHYVGGATLAKTVAQTYVQRSLISEYIK